MVTLRVNLSIIATGIIIFLFLSLPLPLHHVLLWQTFPGVFYEHTSIALFLSDAAIGFLLVLVAAAYRSRSAQFLLPTPHRFAKAIFYPLLLLTIWTAVSVTWAFDVVLTGQQSGRLIILLLLVIAIWQLKPAQTTIQLAAALTVAGQSLVALTQFARQSDLGWRWLGEVELNPYPGGGSILTVGDAYWLRGYGLTPHPNILGGVLAVFLLLLLVAYLQATPRYRPLWLLTLGLGAAGLLITFSRSAWLGMMVGIAFFVAGAGLHSSWRAGARQYGRLLFPALALMVLVAGTLAWRYWPLLHGRFSVSASQTESRSIDERQALIENSFYLIRRFPLTGVGAGNAAVVTIPRVSQMPGVAPQPVHHLPLLLTTELGVAGGVLWLWLMAAPVIIAVYQLRRGRCTLWTWGLTAALVAYAVIDLFDYYAWGWPQGRLLRWTLWALWLAQMSPTGPTAVAADTLPTPGT